MFTFEYLAAAFGRATPRTCAEHYPYITTYHTGLLEQWIEYDPAGRFNPYGLGFVVPGDRIFPLQTLPHTRERVTGPGQSVG